MCEERMIRVHREHASRAGRCMGCWSRETRYVYVITLHTIVVRLCRSCYTHVEGRVKSL